MKRIVTIIFTCILALFSLFACENNTPALQEYGLQYKITYHALFDGELTQVPQDAWADGKSYPQFHIYGEDTKIDDLKSEYDFPIHNQIFSVVFEGWFLDEACTQEFQGINRYNRKETVVYAKLTSNIVYTERNINYQAVFNGQVMEVPQEMFLAQKEYPNIFLEWMSEFVIEDLGKAPYYKPNGEKAYYGFYGWYVDQACTQSFTGITKETSGDVTVYAKLQSEHAIEYKAVVYSVDQNVETKVISVPKGMWRKNGEYPVSYLDCNTDINVDALSKGTYYLDNGSGGSYYFEGWYIDEACTQAFNGLTQDMCGMITLYAKLRATIEWSPVV